MKIDITRLVKGIIKEREKKKFDEQDYWRDWQEPVRGKGGTRTQMGGCGNSSSSGGC